MNNQEEFLNALYNLLQDFREKIAKKESIEESVAKKLDFIIKLLVLKHEKAIKPDEVKKLEGVEHSIESFTEQELKSLKNAFKLFLKEAKHQDNYRNRTQGFRFDEFVSLFNNLIQDLEKEERFEDILEHYLRDLRDWLKANHIDDKKMNAWIKNVRMIYNALLSEIKKEVSNINKAVNALKNSYEY